MKEVSTVTEIFGVAEFLTVLNTRVKRIIFDSLPPSFHGQVYSEGELPKNKIILINSEDTIPEQVITLVHETLHIIKGSSEWGSVIKGQIVWKPWEQIVKEEKIVEKDTEQFLGNPQNRAYATSLVTSLRVSLDVKFVD